MKKIVFAEPIYLTEEDILDFQSEILNIGHSLVFYPDRPTSDEEMISRCVDANMVVISNYPLRRSLLEKLNHLEHIGVAFSGLDHVDLEWCQHRGIRVSNTAGYSTQAVAEQTVLMSLMLLRNAIEMHHRVLSGKDREGFLGQELAGKIVGIIGFGKIGKKVAELFHAFGSKVLVAQHPSILNSPYPVVELDILLANSDLVTLHVPLRKENFHLLSRERIFSMKKGAYLINVARGQVVDYEALKDALIVRHISGAALDVFEIEPPLPLDYPLLSLPNVIFFPHTAYATREAIKRRFLMMKSIIVEWLTKKVHE